jgi:polysaccharide deacetylase 2 family uncharacterized protein YibQ
MPIWWTKSKAVGKLTSMTSDDSKNKNLKKTPKIYKRDFKSYLLFLMTAILLIFVVDEVLWDGERPYITKMKEQYYAEQAAKLQREREAIEALLPPKVVYPETGEAYFEAPVEEEKINELDLQSLVIENEEKQPKEKEEIIAKPKIKQDEPKLTTKPAIGKKPKIAIVIDDVGMNLTQSRAAIALDPNVTIALLPYAEKVKEMAAEAKARGNEIIIHTPMEAMSSDVNLGSMALRTGMNPSDFNDEFLKISQSFEGYVGVNNHMGSRLTQDKQAMGLLMRLLKAQGLYFLDSRTINTSIAAETAAFYGVPYAVRDVFLDHEDTPEFVANALKKTEGVARRAGAAIAIGHPKKNTMQALQKWIPTLEQKGFELVPLSALIQKPLPMAQTVMAEKEVEEKPKIEIKRKSNSSPAPPIRLNLQLPE